MALETVAFMCGAGHSGSTLLGLMLGAHPRVFYAGEAKKSLFLGDETKPLKKRVCKLCGAACPVWSRVTASDPSLYATLAGLSDRAVVVDSSKDLVWVQARASELRSRGARTKLFFVQRDARAVIGSRLRKYPGVSVRKHAGDWLTQIAASRALSTAFPGGAHVVRYELLATQTEIELRAAAAHLGIEYDEAMLSPWLGEPQHPIGGNSGTQWVVSRDPERDAAKEPVLGLNARTKQHYADHPRAIVLDERWRTELTPDVAAEIEDAVGERNEEFAWPAR